VLDQLVGRQHPHHHLDTDMGTGRLGARAALNVAAADAASARKEDVAVAFTHGAPRAVAEEQAAAMAELRARLSLKATAPAYLSLPPAERMAIPPRESFNHRLSRDGDSHHHHVRAMR
jgi:hypothetical protein